MRCQALAEPESAIDGKRLAGDEVRASGEEEHSLGDVLRGAVAAHGSFRSEARGLQLHPSGERRRKEWGNLA